MSTGTSTTTTLKTLEKRYNVSRLQSFFTDEVYDVWYREDKLFYVSREVKCENTYKNVFRVYPNTNDMSIIGNINFLEFLFDDIEEAFTRMNNINAKK